MHAKLQVTTHSLQALHFSAQRKQQVQKYGCPKHCKKEKGKQRVSSYTAMAKKHTQHAKRRGLSVTVETDLFIADFVVTSLKPTRKRQAKHSHTEAQVLSGDSVGTITTPAFR